MTRFTVILCAVLAVSIAHVTLAVQPPGVIVPHAPIAPLAPTVPPTAPPTVPPATPPTVPPTAPPTVPPATPPTAPPATPPASPPAAPVAPATPVAPTPAAPVAPIAPVAPVVPAVPSNGSAPAAPVAPVAPVAPPATPAPPPVTLKTVTLRIINNIVFRQSTPAGNCTFYALYNDNTTNTVMLTGPRQFNEGTGPFVLPINQINGTWDQISVYGTCFAAKTANNASTITPFNTQTYPLVTNASALNSNTGYTLYFWNSGNFPATGAPSTAVTAVNEATNQTIADNTALVQLVCLNTACKGNQTFTLKIDVPGQNSTAVDALNTYTVVNVTGTQTVNLTVYWGNGTIFYQSTGVQLQQLYAYTVGIISSSFTNQLMAPGIQVINDNNWDSMSVPTSTFTIVHAIADGTQIKVSATITDLISGQTNVQTNTLTFGSKPLQLTGKRGNVMDATVVFISPNGTSNITLGANPWVGMPTWVQGVLPTTQLYLARNATFVFYSLDFDAWAHGPSGTGFYASDNDAAQAQANGIAYVRFTNYLMRNDSGNPPPITYSLFKKLPPVPPPSPPAAPATPPAAPSAPAAPAAPGTAPAPVAPVAPTAPGTAPATPPAAPVVPVAPTVAPLTPPAVAPATPAPLAPVQPAPLAPVQPAPLAPVQPAPLAPPTTPPAVPPTTPPAVPATPPVAPPAVPATPPVAPPAVPATPPAVPATPPTAPVAPPAVPQATPLAPAPLAPPATPVAPTVTKHRGVQIVEWIADDYQWVNITVDAYSASDEVPINTTEAWGLYTTDVNGNAVQQTNFAQSLSEGAVIAVYATGNLNSTDPKYGPQITWTNEAANPPSTPAESTSFWKKPWIYIIIAGVVLLLLAAIAYFLKKKREEDENKPLLP